VFGLGDCTTHAELQDRRRGTRAGARRRHAICCSSRWRRPHRPRRYDGYASCPLTTSVGKIMLAEFAYDGVVTPSFPLDPRIPRSAYWHFKKSYLPPLYWGMLRGNLGLDWHAPRSVRRRSAESFSA
jgi:sulfide:quinone oxidoreductase